VALFVGRVAHEKNIAFLLDALLLACRSTNLLLVIAGEGPALGELQAQVRRLGLEDNVQFIGYLDRQQALPDCYAAADAFVFASRTETQGLVLLEAMAAGLPVIALAEMGTIDILGPGRGALVPAAGVEAFAATLAGFFADAALRARLAAEAKVYAGEWSDRALAVRLGDLYRQLAAGKVAAPAPPALLSGEGARQGAGPS
jgi:glycosyltransferase involved in cell wall biosynthesis